jgi:hypothetical protein
MPTLWLVRREAGCGGSASSPPGGHQAFALTDRTSIRTPDLEAEIRIDKRPDPRDWKSLGQRLVNRFAAPTAVSDGMSPVAGHEVASRRKRGDRAFAASVESAAASR